MKNEIEDRKEFYDLLEHVFWAAQGEGCRYKKCEHDWEDDDFCEGCNLYCTNPDGSSLLSDEQEEIVDKVVSMLKKVWKERNVEKRNEMMTKLQENADVKEFNRFYEQEVVPKIQSFCPNVKEEMQFKPWSPELEARVNAWLAKVTNGIDPTAQTSYPSSAPVSNENVVSSTTHNDNGSETTKTTSTTVTSTSDDDDLPF